MPGNFVYDWLRKTDHITMLARAMHQRPRETHDFLDRLEEAIAQRAPPSSQAARAAAKIFAALKQPGSEGDGWASREGWKCGPCRRAVQVNKLWHLNSWGDGVKHEFQLACRR